jgi:hypothetical protein
MLAGWKENQERRHPESIRQKENYGRLFYTGGIIDRGLGWYGKRLLTVTFVNKLSQTAPRYRQTT